MNVKSSCVRLDKQSMDSNRIESGASGLGRLNLSRRRNRARRRVFKTDALIAAVAIRA